MSKPDSEKGAGLRFEIGRIPHSDFRVFLGGEDITDALHITRIEMDPIVGPYPDLLRVTIKVEPDSVVLTDPQIAVDVVRKIRGSEVAE